MKFYTFAQKFLAGFIRCVFRIHVIGSENEPSEGGMIVCSNHQSLWDPVIVGASVHRQVHFMAKAELFKIPGLRLLIKTLGAYPVKRGAYDLKAVKTSLGFLKDGENIGIFPQGTRCHLPDPRTSDVKGGVGMCAYHAKSNILPVAIVPQYSRMRLFSKIYVLIGKPISFEELQINDGEREQYEAASRLIFDRICDLIDEQHEKN